MKLIHLVEDKHPRALKPGRIPLYTRQPLGGKSQFGAPGLR